MSGQLHDIDAHSPTSVTRGDAIVRLRRRKSCNWWLSNGANQEDFCDLDAATKADASAGQNTIARLTAAQDLSTGERLYLDNCGRATSSAARVRRARSHIWMAPR